MNKICTSIEQSQKLLELGIDVNTADMFWLITGKPRLHVLVEDEKYSRWDCMPAWSLSAFLDVLPKNLDIGRPVLATNYKGYYWVSYFDEYMKEKFTSKIYNNPIDACYELILKLYELKML